MSKLSLLFAIALFVCPMTNSLWAQEGAAPFDPYSQPRPYARITFHWDYSCPNHGLFIRLSRNRRRKQSNKIRYLPRKDS